MITAAQSSRGTRPASSAAPESTFGGYTDTGHQIGRWCGRAVIRQTVYRWWQTREKTGFPEGRLIPGRNKPKRVFDYDEVHAWWDAYSERVQWKSRLLVILFTLAG